MRSCAWSCPWRPVYNRCSVPSNRECCCHPGADLTGPLWPAALGHARQVQAGKAGPLRSFERCSPRAWLRPTASSSPGSRLSARTRSSSASERVARSPGALRLGEQHGPIQPANAPNVDRAVAWKRVARGGCVTRHETARSHVGRKQGKQRIGQGQRRQLPTAGAGEVNCSRRVRDPPPDRPIVDRAEEGKPPDGPMELLIVR